MFKYASWVILLVDALEASWWTNWCLHLYCVSMSDIFDVALANRLDLNPLTPGWGDSLSMLCRCRLGEIHDNEKNWKVLSTT